MVYILLFSRFNIFVCRCILWEKGPYMLSGETMMSICKTLETIDFCCHRDAYSDAYTLLRKYRDDLMQYLFVLNVIQNKHGLTDEEAEEFTINSESMMKMIELDVSILVSGERKTDAELAMENGFIMYWKVLKIIRIENNFLMHQNTNHIW